MKKASIFALVAALNFLAAPAIARADHELEAGRGPDGKIVVYCDFCLIYNCDCNTGQI